MYYDRTLSDSFSALIEPKGELRWLFDYVKNNERLDFLIGKSNGKEWISVYMGLTRILSIHPTKNPNEIKIDASKTYKDFPVSLYGVKSRSYNFQNDMARVINLISKDKSFHRYYENRKEGYYQSILSRRYGILGEARDDFVILDKEAVIGYENTAEKRRLFGPIQKKYKSFQSKVSALNPSRYGSNLNKKAIGNELDFLALDTSGNILLIEYKHGTNTSGIYLSPLQIGMYYELFTQLSKTHLEQAVFSMLNQKKKIGLINPKWNQPSKITKIIPVLMISEYNYKASAKEKYGEILDFLLKQPDTGFLNDIRTYNYINEPGLKYW